MDTETFSTFTAICEKFGFDESNDNLINICSRMKKLKINDKIFYNEIEFIKELANGEKYFYIRIDSEEQSKDTDKIIDEFKENFPNYNVVVGISPPEIINSSLIFLLRRCMTGNIGEITFYSKSNCASKEIKEIISMIAKLKEVKLSYYKD
jgi:hypothetical protein